MKRPAFQFYPGDWLRDTALRSCSVSARGLWIEMLCLMHEGEPYGHLKVGQKVILPANLARMVGEPLEVVEGWLHELSEAGVYSIDDSGCIYSRRMVRDEEIRTKRAAGGHLGGNPSLKKPKKDAGEVGEKVNLPPNLEPTPASSSASASSNTENPTSEQSPDKQKAKGRKKHGTQEDHDAARYIFGKVRTVDQTAKEPNWDSWANEVRLMREQDGRTHREICELFTWANSDSFWKSNILCPAKLREKWTQLQAKRRTSAGHGGRTPERENFIQKDYGESGPL